MHTEQDREGIRQRVARSRARSAMLERRLAAALWRNKVIVREAVLLRERRLTAKAHNRSLMRFRLEGWLGDAPVAADYDGGLHADPRLLTHAGLLVDLGEVIRFDAYGVALPATLDGAPEAILLTLFSACDRVTAVSLDVGMPRLARSRVS
jgi:hypothetical protein